VIKTRTSQTLREEERHADEPNTDPVDSRRPHGPKFNTRWNRVSGGFGASNSCWITRDKRCQFNWSVQHHLS
jgi:hypothetical protein